MPSKIVDGGWIKVSFDTWQRSLFPYSSAKPDSQMIQVARVRDTSDLDRLRIRLSSAQRTQNDKRPLLVEFLKSSEAKRIKNIVSVVLPQYCIAVNLKSR